MAAKSEITRDMVGLERKTIKLLVWDLDNTLWQGTLLEGDRVFLRSRIRDTLAALDQRGILLSIASRNDHDAAMQKLSEFQLVEYFLYPQINWNSKAANIQTIAKSINIGLDSVAFIDDEDFEREEVRDSCPQVTVLAAVEADRLLEMDEFIPPFITEDSAQRRAMYLADIERSRVEEQFVGPKEEFLASLNMKLVIAKAKLEDLQRAEELTRRTNQLNSTGYTYSYVELNALRQSPNYLLLIAALDDKFGTYGKIGLALIERSPATWTIKLLLVSCRVMPRGIGTILINHILALGREAGVRIRSEFRSNGRNRMMLMAFKFSGFKEAGSANDTTVFEHHLKEIQPVPDWIRLHNLDEQTICKPVVLTTP